MSASTIDNFAIAVQELSEQIKDLRQDLKDSIELNKNSEFSLERDFDIINLPSEGKFYFNKKGSLLIKYLSAQEEKLLTNSLLLESGKALEFVLRNLVIDKDINIEDLLLSDFQAIQMFLRSTAYGDKINLNLNCPNCTKANEEVPIYLSSLKFKENRDEPSEDGLYHITLPKTQLYVKIKPLTFREEMEALSMQESIFYLEDGEKKEIKRQNTTKLVSHIKEINGVTDKKKISTIVKKIPKTDSDVLKEFIEKNEVGIDNTFTWECEFCDHENKHTVDFGYNFLSLPASYKQTILEEIFLITYYGKGITRQDAMNMAVFERKWHINRIQEEVEKKNEAEKAAAESAKRGSKSGRR